MQPQGNHRRPQFEREMSAQPHAGPWHIGEILPTVLAAVLGEGSSRDARGASPSETTVTPAVLPQPWWPENSPIQGWGDDTPATTLCGQSG